MPEEPNASFMRSLCMGHIEQDMLFPFPVLPAGQRDTLQEISAALDDLLTPRGEEMRQGVHQDPAEGRHGGGQVRREQLHAGTPLQLIAGRPPDRASPARPGAG